MKEFSYQIIIGENDYIMLAKVFRGYLIETNQFVSLEEKAKKIKDLDKLYGAAQIYLWSSGVLDRRDIGNWLGFVREINNNKNKESISKRIIDLLSEELGVVKLVQSYSEDGYVDEYGRKTIIRGINEVLKRKDFYKESAFGGQKKSKKVKALLNKGINNLNINNYLSDRYLIYKNYSYLNEAHDEIEQFDLAKLIQEKQRIEKKYEVTIIWFDYYEDEQHFNSEVRYRFSKEKITLSRIWLIEDTINKLSYRHEINRLYDQRGIRIKNTCKVFLKRRKGYCYWEIYT